MATMNKKQLLTKMARGSEKNYYLYAAVLDSMIATIVNELVNNDVTVKLQGLGTFYVKKKPLATTNG